MRVIDTEEGLEIRINPEHRLGRIFAERLKAVVAYNTGMSHIPSEWGLYEELACIPIPEYDSRTIQRMIEQIFDDTFPIKKQDKDAGAEAQGETVEINPNPIYVPKGPKECRAFNLLRDVYMVMGEFARYVYNTMINGLFNAADRLSLMIEEEFRNLSFKSDKTARLGQISDMETRITNYIILARSNYTEDRVRIIFERACDGQDYVFDSSSSSVRIARLSVKQSPLRVQIALSENTVG